MDVIQRPFTFHELLILFVFSIMRILWMKHRRHLVFFRYLQIVEGSSVCAVYLELMMFP